MPLVLDGLKMPTDVYSDQNIFDPSTVQPEFPHGLKKGQGAVDGKRALLIF